MAKATNYTEEQLEIAAFAKAMSHPVRVFLLQKLLHSNTCFYSGDLIDELPIGRSGLSLHLKELKLAGLIKGSIEAPHIKYCLNEEKWQELTNLFSTFLQKSVTTEIKTCKIENNPK
jgi:predicted transcriptional regulator